MKFPGKKIRAFTLIEALVCLVIISGSLLLFKGMTELVVHEVHHQRNGEERSWLLFAKQLAFELDKSQFMKVEGNKLYVKQGQKEIAFGKSRADDFRKTDYRGRGYKPMVFGVKEARIEKVGGLIQFHFQFEQGLEREFYYRVEEKN